jgi:GDP-4-dehydro-6-deoxy-D-mannose reductase
MRILITGANGFVGTHLIRLLRRAEPQAQILGLVHGPNPPYAEAAVRFAPGDITDEADIHALIRRERPDHLYHLAGAASGAGQDHEAIWRANVMGTRHVMAALSEEAPLARALFTSTGYVYGDCDQSRPAREGDALRPVGLYAESKRDAEGYARAGGAVVARAFNHTGPGQGTGFAAAAFAAQVAAIERGEQEPALRVGNLEARRDFLDVRDVVRAYHLLMTHGEPGGVYNVCRGEAITMQSVLDGLLSLSSAPIMVMPDPARMRPADIAVSVGDPAKLHASTGWVPELSFRQTLSDTLDWWRERENPSRAH